MAKFEIASAITGINEGGYANNPNDKGGETYAGISRKFWPNWSGWNRIDEIKKQNGSDAHTINIFAHLDMVLQGLIQQFYKQNFWDANKLDQVTDQQLANTVYDFGVNSGVARAADTLQQVASVSIDGIVGMQTINAINALNGEIAYNAYNEIRTLYYHRIAIGDQAQFLKSWLSRLKPYQK